VLQDARMALRRPPHRLRRSLVQAACLAALLGPGTAATAHEGDPRVVTTIVRVSPSLPDRVVVQVQPSLAAQLVVDNPTATPLEVLDDQGRPFLRLSSGGVEADVRSPSFVSTSSPSGAVPPSAVSPEPNWQRISAGSSWGWFDHRLHPEAQTGPRDPAREAELGRWQVPLRYGADDVAVEGVVRFVPLLGSFVVTADPGPPGVTVQALPGRLPGVFLANPGRRPLTVLGADGEPFLRFDDGGLSYNEASRTYVEDRAARGAPAGPPSPEVRFGPPDPGATSATWLDARLRYPDDLPPDDVVRRGEPAVLGRWSVPIQLDGSASALGGEVRWVPDPALRPTEAAGEGARTGVVALAAGAVAAVAAAVVALRRRAARGNADLWKPQISE
jgi:hypothetical protein